MRNGKTYLSCMPITCWKFFMVPSDDGFMVPERARCAWRNCARPASTARMMLLPATEMRPRNSSETACGTGVKA